ncbi:MAG: hypothetical protein ACRBBP_00145 [Bdellovibrionales bacterium]
MKFLFLIVSLLVFQAEAAVVTSLNIEWFGRGGDIYGSIKDEYRGERLKEYIHEVLPESDVYVFQEITHKESLFEIMSGFECISYDAGTSRHQFVVMCSKKGLLKEHKVNQEVRLGRKGLRAALIGDYEINNKKIRIVGVHLKAGFKDTTTRLEQVEALQPDLNKADSVMVVGDFNTYKKDRTNLLKDDSFMITESLGGGFSLVENETPTYMGFGGACF